MLKLDDQMKFENFLMQMQDKSAIFWHSVYNCYYFMLFEMPSLCHQDGDTIRNKSWIPFSRLTNLINFFLLLNYLFK